MPSETTRQIQQLIKDYEVSRERGISLNAASSETLAPAAAMCASSLVSLTAEGYPGHRYHSGTAQVDKIEQMAIEQARQTFNVRLANVQLHSCSSANAAVLLSLLDAGDTIMGMDLRQGGHLTHGSKASFSGKFFRAVGYGLRDERICLDEVRTLALKHRPRLIFSGASAYPRFIDFEGFGSIAREVGAVHLADISHISGLVAEGFHASPIPHATLVTTSTYKQIYGPRGGLILSGQEEIEGWGIKMKSFIDRCCFPFLQGTPNFANIAAKAIALEHAQTPAFREAMQRVLRYAKRMADVFMDHGLKVVSGGTDNHMVILDLKGLGVSGLELERVLEQIGIFANRNLIADDPRPPFQTSGLRFGTNHLALYEIPDEVLTRIFEMIVDLIQHRAAGRRIEVEVWAAEVAALKANFVRKL